MIADPNCPSELIKNKKWNEIARQAIQGDLKLADMNGQKEAHRNTEGTYRNVIFYHWLTQISTSSSGKKCTLIPPATHLEILDAMMRPKAGIKENEDFSIEFNFKYFGQSDSEGSVQKKYRLISFDSNSKIF